MKFVLPKTFLILVFSIFFCEALECGIHMNRNQDLQSTIMKCIKNNKTLEDLRELGSYSSESSSSSSEEQTGVDSRISQFRSKRATQRKELKELSVTGNDNSKDHANTSEETVSENCIVHCILSNLNLTDATGYPVHSKLMDGLMKNATGRELKDFLQDSTDECFQEMSREIAIDPCEYSIKLVTCLADRGKLNCADWPAGDIPFSQ